MPCDLPALQTRPGGPGTLRRGQITCHEDPERGPCPVSRPRWRHPRTIVRHGRIISAPAVAVQRISRWTCLQCPYFMVDGKMTQTARYIPKGYLARASMVPSACLPVPSATRSVFIALALSCLVPRRHTILRMLRRSWRAGMIFISSAIQVYLTTGSRALFGRLRPIGPGRWCLPPGCKTNFATD